MGWFPRDGQLAIARPCYVGNGGGDCRASLTENPYSPKGGGAPQLPRIVRNAVRRMSEMRLVIMRPSSRRIRIRIKTVAGKKAQQGDLQIQETYGDGQGGDDSGRVNIRRRMYMIARVWYPQSRRRARSTARKYWRTRDTNGKRRMICWLHAVAGHASCTRGIVTAR